MSAFDTTLYQMLLVRLQSGDFDNTSEKDLVEAVRKDYLSGGSKAKIPNPVTGDFVSALEVEIRDMLKTITYGHFDIKSYNLSRKSH